MDRWLRAWLETFVVAFFAAGALLVALRPDPVLQRGGSYMEMLERYTAPNGVGELMSSEDLVGIVQNPVNIWLIGLLATVLLSCVGYLALRWWTGFSRPFPVLVLLGLAAGTVWPWVSAAAPAFGVTLALAAPVGVVAGLLTNPKPSEPVDWLLALIAGWLTVGATGATMGLAQVHLNLQSELSALGGLLALSLIGAQVQLWLGSSVTYALAIIWAMLGVAVASLGLSTTVSTACVLGIATMAVVIVRVTT